MDTTLQLRIDASTKAKAQKILKELGMDLSSAIKVFLTQVVRSKSLPIKGLTVNGYTVAQEQKFLRQVRTEKLSKRFSSVEEMMDDMMS